MTLRVSPAPQQSNGGLLTHPSRIHARLATAFLSGALLFHTACTSDPTAPHQPSICDVYVQPFHVLIFNDNFCSQQLFVGKGKVNVGETVSITSVKITLEKISLLPDNKTPSVQLTLHDSYTNSTVHISTDNGILYTHLAGKSVSIRSSTIAEGCNPQWAALEINICPSY